MATSGHWYAIQIVKKKANQLEITVMDSLGDGEHARSSAFDDLSRIVSNFITNNPAFSTSELYYNRERMQFDPENCGTFSAQFCKKMLKSPDFVAELKLSDKIVTQREIKPEKTEFTQLFSVPETYYFNQYMPLGGTPERIANSIEKQFAHVQQIQSDVLLDRFNTLEFGEAEHNPYYQIYKAIIQRRSKYWDKVVEQYFSQHPTSEIARIIENRKIENLTIDKMIAQLPKVQAQPLKPMPSTSTRITVTPKSASSARGSSFNYREYVKMCGSMKNLDLDSTNSDLDKDKKSDYRY